MEIIIQESGAMNPSYRLRINQQSSREVVANKVAWSAVKKEYSKDKSGKWQKD